MYSKKLRKQLKKSLGVESPEQVLKVFSENHQVGLSKFENFLDRIDRSYTEYEDRLKISERNIDISSSELSAANAKLSVLSQAIAGMVDSLGEGYLVFDKNGLCDNVYSKICEQIFGRSPSGNLLSDLLQLQGNDKESYDMWLNLSFSGRLSEEDLNSLGPQRFLNKNERYYKLRFRPMITDRNIHRIVMIATDITKEIEANIRASKKVEEATALLNVAKDKEGFKIFIESLNETLANLKGLFPKGDQLKKICFDLHTLKGGASVFSLHEIEELVHQEELNIRQNSSFYAKSDLDQFIVKMENLRSATLSKYQPIIGGNSGLQPFLGELPEEFKLKVLQLLDEGLREDHADALINQAVGSDLLVIFERFARLVEVTSVRLSKNVTPLKIEGPPIRIPYRPYRTFFASLVHVFRNALDHGIEDSEERIAAGKDQKGAIKVIYDYDRSKNGFQIDIIDDGRGIDIDFARESLRGICPQEDLAQWSDDQILNTFMFAGVSLKSSVTEVSGMGVGCGAVAEEIKKLGGSLTVSSSPNQGTRFRFWVPYISWPAMLLDKKLAA